MMENSNNAGRTLDLRGVACPMNYVKILVALEELKPGEEIEAVIDDEKSLVDIPRSAKMDGHIVKKVVPDGDAYRLTIEKGDTQ